MVWTRGREMTDVEREELRVEKGDALKIGQGGRVVGMWRREMADVEREGQRAE